MKGCDYGGDVDASSRAIFASRASAALVRLAKGLSKNFRVHCVTTLTYKVPVPSSVRLLFWLLAPSNCNKNSGNQKCR